MSVEFLSEPLKKILDAELALGNQIQEISAWPPRCHLLVILRKPFNHQYEVGPDVEFAEINDTHYWKSEYRYRGGIQALACNFGR